MATTKENAMIEQMTDVRQALVERLAEEYRWIAGDPGDERASGAISALIDLGEQLGFDKLRRDARELASQDR